jgi:hypothetical protein
MTIKHGSYISIVSYFLGAGDNREHLLQNCKVIIKQDDILITGHNQNRKSGWQKAFNKNFDAFLIFHIHITCLSSYIKLMITGDKFKIYTNFLFKHFILLLLQFMLPSAPSGHTHTKQQAKLLLF